jgi:hypothetical protein
VLELSGKSTNRWSSGPVKVPRGPIGGDKIGGVVVVHAIISRHVMIAIDERVTALVPVRILPPWRRIYIRDGFHVVGD